MTTKMVENELLILRKQLVTRGLDSESNVLFPFCSCLTTSTYLIRYNGLFDLYFDVSY